MDPTFTPYEGRFGYATYTPIRSQGDVSSMTAAQGSVDFDLLEPTWLPDGIQLQLVVLEDVNSVMAYYANEPIGKKDTLLDFLEGGGILIAEGEPNGSTGQRIKERLGDRAALVAIADHDAALNHADPLDEDGLRTYNLAWEDPTRRFVMEGNVATPELVMDVARSLYCPDFEP